MTPLHFEHLVWRLQLTENEVLDYLQEHGVISDHCTSTRHIARADLQTAADFLEVGFMKNPESGFMVAYAEA